MGGKINKLARKNEVYEFTNLCPEYSIGWYNRDKYKRIKGRPSGRLFYFMSCAFNFYVSEVCTKRFGYPKGSFGRANCQPLAIVIHQLKMSYEEYVADLSRDLSSSSLYTNPVIPRSVHFLFNRDGNGVHVVDTGDTAWGLNGMQNPTAVASAIVGAQTYPDRVLLHIAFEDGGCTSQALQSAANVICCWALQYNIPIDAAHILDAVEFNDDEDFLGGVPQILFQMASACFAQGGAMPPPDPIPSGLAVTIAALQKCCTDRTNEVIALTARIAALENFRAQDRALIDDLLARVVSLEHNQFPTNLLPGIFSQLNALTQEVEKLKICAHKVCGDDCPPTTCTNIHYRIDRESQYQLIPPLVNTWLFANGSTKIDDSVPPQVLNSALWNAYLTCACSWKIQVTVHISLRDWCAGKEIWLDMVSDLGRQRLDTKVQAGGLNDPTLTGSTVLVVPPNTNVHFEIATNDNRMAQIIVDYADVQITC